MKKLLLILYIFFIASCSQTYYYSVYDYNGYYLGDLIDYSDYTLYIRSPEGYYYTLDGYGRFAQGYESTFPIYSLDSAPTADSTFYIDGQWQGEKQYGMFTLSMSNVDDIPYCDNGSTGSSVLNNLYKFVIDKDHMTAQSYNFAQYSGTFTTDVIPVVTATTACNNGVAGLPSTITSPYYIPGWYSWWFGGVYGNKNLKKIVSKSKLKSLYQNSSEN